MTNHAVILWHRHPKAAPNIYPLLHIVIEEPALVTVVLGGTFTVHAFPNHLWCNITTNLIIVCQAEL